MTRAAKATLTVSAALCIFTVWGVHWLQFKERDVSFPKKSRIPTDH